MLHSLRTRARGGVHTAASACAAAPPPPGHSAECCPRATTRAPAPPYPDARGIAWVACRCDGASVTPCVIRIAKSACLRAERFLQQDDRHVRNPRDLTCTGSATRIGMLFAARHLHGDAAVSAPASTIPLPPVASVPHANFPIPPSTHTCGRAHLLVIVCPARHKVKRVPL